VIWGEVLEVPGMDLPPAQMPLPPGGSNSITLESVSEAMC